MMYVFSLQFSLGLLWKQTDFTNSKQFVVEFDTQDRAKFTNATLVHFPQEHKTRLPRSKGSVSLYISLESSAVISFCICITHNRQLDAYQFVCEFMS